MKFSTVCLSLCLASALALVLASQSQAAMYLIDFNVKSGTSLNVKLSTTVGSQTKPMTLTGTLEGTLDTTNQTFQIDSALISGSNVSFSLLFGAITAAITNPKLDWTSSALPYSGTAINLGGSELSIFSGNLTSNVADPADFSTDPVNFSLPNPTNGTIVITDPVLPNITLAVPVNSVNDLGSGNSVTLTGTINFVAVHSVAIVPEPSSVLLASFAAVGLCCAGRRRFRRR